MRLAVEMDLVTQVQFRFLSSNCYQVQMEQAVEAEQTLLKER